MEYPEYLYCYFNIDKGLRFLRDLKFRLSSITDFNDPFECLFTTDYPLFYLSLDDKLTEDEINTRLDILSSNNFFAAKNYVENKSKGRINLIKNLRVGCFSETPDNVLMWSHYCWGNQGIVVKFKVSLGHWGNDLYKVNYVSERASINEFDPETIGASNQERNLLTTKSVHWSYEHEWRYIKTISDCDRDNKGYYKKVDIKAIKGIIIACRTKYDDINEIKSILGKKGVQIPLFIAKPGYSKFNYDITDLDNYNYLLMWSR